MAAFRYKAMDEQGKSINGRMNAANETELDQHLDNMGLTLISSKKIKEGRGSKGQKISRQDLISFCFHMEQMGRVGVPIIESLQDLRDGMDNPRFCETVSVMIASIQGGKTFSEALAEFPQVFDEVFVNLIRVGEHSGELTKVLLNITETLKWQDELAEQSKKMMMYPLFVGTVMIGVVFFLMIYLVPQMMEFITNMGHELPMHTKVLIAVSDFFTQYWYLIIATPMSAFFLIKHLAKTNPKVRYQVDNFKLNVWLIGPIVQKIILSRFANYMAMLYASGVTVLEGIKISEDIVANKVIATALSNARQNIADGRSMSDSFERTGLFPPLVLRMIKIGENTGGLDTALQNISYFYNRDVKAAIDKVQTMIEPIMTVVLGLILGWVIMSVLGPIYDIISKIKM